MSLPNGNKYPPTNLIDAPIPISGVFDPIGDTIQTNGQRTMLLWLDVEFNSSTEIQLCIIAKQTIGGDPYEFPIQNKGFEDVEIRRLVYRLIDTTYEKIPLPIEFNDLVPYVKIAIRAIGGPPWAVLNKLDYSMRS